MKYIYYSFVAVLAVFLTTSCDALQNGDSPANVQVQMQVENTAALGKVATGSGTQSAANDIVLEEVKLFVEEFELESLRDDDYDFELDDIIVNLPLDGTPFTVTQQEVRPGLYEEFEMEVERPGDDTQVSDSDFSDDTGRYSIAVRGTFNGEEFFFRSKKDFELEMDLNPPLEIAEGEEFSLTLGVDLSKWFYDAESDDYLDPSDEANLAKINNSIAKSFKMHDDYSDYEDDDDDDDDQDDDDDDDSDDDDDDSDDNDDDDDDN